MAFKFNFGADSGAGEESKPASTTEAARVARAPGVEVFPAPRVRAMELPPAWPRGQNGPANVACGVVIPADAG